jgi:hypothetical protein
LNATSPRLRGEGEEAEPHAPLLHYVAIKPLRRSLMGRYMLLWLLGVPIPVLLLIYAFGGLH